MANRRRINIVLTKTIFSREAAIYFNLCKLTGLPLKAKSESNINPLGKANMSRLEKFELKFKSSSLAYSLIAAAFIYFAAISPAPLQAEERQLIKISRVVDGDTLKLSDGRRVRLIGVNTPELHDDRRIVREFAVAAQQYLRRICEGRLASLTFDQQRLDKYGRTLAYVTLENGQMANRSLIEEGYGYAFTKYPFRYASEFRDAERTARKRRKGLWAKS